MVMNFIFPQKAENLSESLSTSLKVSAASIKFVQSVAFDDNGDLASELMERKSRAD
jgi:hypothetical protein